MNTRILIVFCTIGGLYSAIFPMSQSHLDQKMLHSALYKMWKKKQNPEHIVCLQPEVILQSAKVGGEGSCGYHALKNGVLIARSIFTKINPEDDLKSISYVDKLFGSPESSWRSIVVAQRAELFAYTRLVRLLKQQLVKPKDTVSSLSTHAIPAVAKHVAKNYVFSEIKKGETVYRCTIDESSLGKLFDEELGRHSIAFELEEIDFIIEKESLIHFIANNALDEWVTCDDLLSYYFTPSERITIDKTFFEYCLTLQEEDRASRTLKLGDWLSENTLEQIVGHEHAQNNSLFGDYPISVYTLNCPEFLGHTFDQAFYEKRDIQQVAQNIKIPATQAVIIFIISIGDHWIACVINKQPYREPCYILTTSDNTDLIRHKSLKSFISKLEGKNVILEKIEDVIADRDDLKKHIEIYVSLLKNLHSSKLSWAEYIKDKATRLYNETAPVKITCTEDFRLKGNQLRDKMIQLRDIRKKLSILSQVTQRTSYICTPITHQQDSDILLDMITSKAKAIKNTEKEIYQLQKDIAQVRSNHQKIFAALTSLKVYCSNNKTITIQELSKIFTSAHMSLTPIEKLKHCNTVEILTAEQVAHMITQLEETYQKNLKNVIDTISGYLQEKINHNKLLYQEVGYLHNKQYLLENVAARSQEGEPLTKRARKDS